MSIWEKPCHTKKKNKFKSAEEAKRHRELEASWSALKTKHVAPSIGPNAGKTPSKLSANQQRIKELLNRDATPVNRPLMQEAFTEQLPRMPSRPRYDGDMLRREQLAREETAALKSRVGPVGNKMGDQYLTDTDLKDAKAGLLRRRS